MRHFVAARDFGGPAAPLPARASGTARLLLPQCRVGAVAGRRRGPTEEGTRSQPVGGSRTGAVVFSASHSSIRTSGSSSERPRISSTRRIR